MAPTPGQHVDVAIAGAGVVGLATALAVIRARAPRPRVLLCDPGFGGTPPPPRTLRAVAIASAARRFLEDLGVWAVVEASAAPMTSMVLTDSRVGAVPAPDFLHFPGSSSDGEPLAHMVVQDDVRAALIEACRAAGVMLRPHAITTYRPQAGFAVIDTSDGPVRCRLLVAADGGRSQLRDHAGIGSVGWDYDQSGIVATLAHSRDHGGEAIQHFLPGGPLAFLPMRAPDGSGRRSSIVWTERRAEAERLAALGGADFCAALAARGGFERGELTLEDRPTVYPLRLRLARSLVAPRLALAGDAARTIHPLAGQGLNLGLGDAEALGRRIEAALALGLDPGSARVLDGYQRDRRADQVRMAGTTDLINRLFSNDHAPLRLARDVGLGLVERSGPLKRWLQRGASGA